mmetsp:Transcript_103/g.272  ORF Transcript_103/g.272 Transcript_103/m.272 type:complete len:409 (+) Transcript_103:137-1363(+)|eukprot:CAMPEP_0197193948 /NCGR_PEP_ID=MMETSP1423-20130617/28332_1 /TAXON_ID=476441 /ORGANISM="Pseudo-nitzschia heimii, Strain UNC1101" /LENGTH=408 /DNA_ID=CAMNT_0042647279 /DNA_START=173 /DNA_END=1399 /DNA_ORIENTATION=+
MYSRNRRVDQSSEGAVDDNLVIDQVESLHDNPVTPDKRSPTEYIFKKGTSSINSATTTTSDEAEDEDEAKALANEEIPELESPELQVGDHVYQWRSLCGVPFMFQHHGIVMDVIKDEGGKPVRLAIADFSNVETKETKKNQKRVGSKTSASNANVMEIPKESTPNTTSPEDDTKEHPSRQSDTESGDTTKITRSPIFSSRRASLEQEGIMRTYTDTDKWHKVHYQSGFWKRQLCRAGTVTKANSDPVGLVLARVNFIMQHPEQLPDYHVVHANCECVAFWCKTGRWSTLQASSFLELTAAGQAKSSATLAATAASTTANVTVPTAGIWGSWFGFTTTANVSWLSIHPMAIPGLACYAAITIGVPAVMYATAHKKWKETTERLSTSFWDSAMANPDVFAECLTHWSDKG